MSSNDIAVSVRGLSKAYTISHNAEKATTLGEALVNKVKKPTHRAERETFWAIKDIDFEIKKGDVVGIIGRNGAGKSTLLKVLSQITEPTRGEIRLYGRVGSLLEVGTGFHPELTGRENIYLNGAILGMRKSEILRQFDAIVEFSGVEQFLDTPVKRYSSGMYVRLAFAVAAHLNPEILIVDEVLAVGDAEFQKKCIGKMQDVSKQEGKTILFVSHNMAAIKQLCNKGIWLGNGSVHKQGEAAEVVSAYFREGNGNSPDKFYELHNAPGDDTTKLTSVRVCQPPGTTCGEIDITKPFEIEVDTHSLSSVSNVAVNIVITSEDGQIIIHTSNLMSESEIMPVLGKKKVTCSFPAYTLNNGNYRVTTGIDVPNIRLISLEENVVSFSVNPMLTQLSRYNNERWPGVVGPGIAKWFETHPHSAV